VPAAGPGRITLTAALPEGGTLETRGTGEILPPSSDLAVEVRGLDATLAQIWLPQDAAITPVAGKVGATLSMRYARAPGLAVGGRVWITEPPPSDGARRLAERRESVTRTHLVDAAGIAADRFVREPGAPPIGAKGEGRVEFALEPAS